MCLLCTSRQRVVQSTLVENSRVMLIGEAPGKDEEALGMPFQGQAGKILSDILKEVGIDKSTLSVASVVSCRPPANRAPLPAEITACSAYLERDIAEAAPEVIVLLGSTALNRFIPKSGGITRARGIWQTVPNTTIKFLPTFLPAYILRNPNQRQKLVDDFKKVRSFLEGLSVEKVPCNYYAVRTISQLDWLVNKLLTEELWAFDTETTGLNFLSDKIFMFNFSWKEHTGVTVDIRDFPDCQDYVWGKMREVLVGPAKKIMQNGAFDIKMLMSAGIYVKHYYADTILMHYLLNENDNHGLEILAEQFTDDMAGYDLPLAQYRKEHKIDRYDELPKEILEPYAAGDADVTLRAYNKMFSRLQEEGLEYTLMNVMMPIQKILLYTEFSGVSIDLPHLKETQVLYAKLMAEQLRVVMAAPEVRQYLSEKQSAIDAALYAKWEKSALLLKKFPTFLEYMLSLAPEKKTAVFNLSSTTQKKELLIDQMGLPVLDMTLSKAPKLGAAQLLEYAKKNKFCANLQKYSNLQHQKSTFLDGILERLSSDNKIRTEYYLYSTDTGRPSSRNPNLNNIPKNKTAESIKDIFSADSGCWLVDSDMGQAEFRVWIVYSQDDQARRDLEMGIDIHKLMAAVGYHGVPLPLGDISWDKYQDMIKDVTKDERNDSKFVVFGAMYGRGAQSVSEQLGIAVSKAQFILDSFFKRYKKSKQWLNETMLMARKEGYVVGLFGRRRRLPGASSSNKAESGRALRQAVNAPIQGAASDMTLLAATRILSKAWSKGFKTRLVLTVYDSLVFNVPDNELLEMLPIIKHEMLTPALDSINVPLAVEMKVGKTWGSTIEVDPDRATEFEILTKLDSLRRR